MDVASNFEQYSDSCKGIYSCCSSKFAVTFLYYLSVSGVYHPLVQENLGLVKISSFLEEFRGVHFVFPGVVRVFRMTFTDLSVRCLCDAGEFWNAAGESATKDEKGSKFCLVSQLILVL